MSIKTFVAAAIFAATIAAPALAHTTAAPIQVGAPASYSDEGDASIRLRATKRSYDLYHNGKYVGSTPDPNIRQLLQREFDEW